MKKYIAIFLFLWLLFPSASVSAQEVKQSIKKDTTAKKQDPKNAVQNKSSLKKSKKIKSEAQKEEQRKKDIEAKEYSVNKNKKVRRFGIDENIPETVKKRNIP